MDRVSPAFISFLAWGGAIVWLGVMVVFSVSRADFRTAALMDNTVGEIFSLFYLYPVMANFTPPG
ncbi:hypothetical protein OAN95_06315, partial [Alphaproteobacteria bacterium]|nr:hypothetical protein [Alphaproteobacteria bacterium]